MMAPNISQMKLCATCLLFSNLEFPVSDDIKGILRSLLFDFDIDDFFKSIPPDKQLKLCYTCNNRLQQMIVFKERALKSFSQLKKLWDADMANQTTRDAVGVPSSLQAANYTPLYTIKIENPKELKCVRPDPLEVNKSDKESITNSNVYDSFIDIKEEIDPETLNQPKPVDIVNQNIKQEAIPDNNNASTSRTENFNHNMLTPQTNCNISHNIAPVVLNYVAIPIKNCAQNKLAAMTFDSSSRFIHHNVAIPSKENFNRNPFTIKMIPVTVPAQNNPAQNSVPALCYNNFDNKLKRIQLNVQKPPEAVTTSKSLSNSGPNPKIDITQNAIDGDAISASDSESEGEFPSDNGDRMNKIRKKGGSEFKANVNSDEMVAYEGQKKWYLKLLTREEVINKMVELRNHPGFSKAPHKCVSCVALYPNEMLLEEHNKECHSEDSEFTCFACQCTFKDINALKSHYPLHTIDINEYHCITCEFQTGEIRCIRKHICPNAGSNRLPPKDPRTMRLSKCSAIYYCHKCEYITTRSASLLLHYDFKHKPNAKVACDECGNMYNKRNLRQHVDLMHKGKKPQQEPVFCNICNKWLSSKNVYNTHMINIHPREELLKFQCDECEKKFLTAKHLGKHKELHAIMKGGYSSNLRKHMPKHSDARPYKCCVCGDTFKYSAALYTHTKLKHEKKKRKKKNSEQSPHKDKGQNKTKTVKRKRE